MTGFLQGMTLLTTPFASSALLQSSAFNAIPPINAPGGSDDYSLPVDWRITGDFLQRRLEHKSSLSIHDEAATLEFVREVIGTRDNGISSGQYDFLITHEMLRSDNSSPRLTVSIENMMGVVPRSPIPSVPSAQCGKRSKVDTGRIAHNDRERLLFEVRKLVAIQFGGALPFRLDGIPPQNKQSILRRYIAGEIIKYNRKLTPENLYGQIYALLVNVLGMTFGSATRLIRGAIIEELRMGHGDVLPHLFYPPARRVLIKFGMPEEDATIFVRQLVFKYKSWDEDTKTANKVLLHEARVAVADEFGGQIPLHHKIPDVPPQNEDRPLSRWINSGHIAFSRGHTEYELYRQVTQLLLGLGREVTDVRRWVNAAYRETHSA